jgi:uncharacterized damage-inducible protein DinB
MPLIDQVVDQLQRAFDGEAWHGPALMEVLEGIDAETAADRPIPGAHSIWELVDHITAWEGVVARRIQGQAATVSDEENFGQKSGQKAGPQPGPKSPASDSAWRDAVAKLRDTHNNLIKLAALLSEPQLNEIAPGKDYALLFMLLGTVQHAAYHGGQIALLRRSRS